MRKTNIRKFRANLLKELNDLPFELTRKGEVVAVVCTPEFTGLSLPEVSIVSQSPVSDLKDIPKAVTTSNSEWSGGYPKVKQAGRKKK